MAHADFARDHPLTPVDFRWFGGISTFGYSLWAPLVMAWIGARLTGAACSVIATAQLTLLFRRTGAPHPLLGGLAGALAQTLNLVDGRFSFSVGMVCGLGALLPLSKDERGRRELVCTAVLACLAGAASPVAALLLWVCAAALVLVRRFIDGVVLLSASAAPVAVITALFSDAGNEPFVGRDAREAAIATAVVLIALPRSRPVLRWGAVLGLLMVLGAYFVDTPVGNNSARLSLLFAAPVLIAYIAWRWWLAVVAIGAVIYPQQMSYRYAFTWGPSSGTGYYAPLIAELEARGPLTGRVEVPETNSHFDDAYLARAVPLARGWLRQLDVKLNGPVFFDGSKLSVNGYRRFLAANSVQYVAVPDARLTKAGDRERSPVLEGRLPYLTEIWHDEHWHLYAVNHPQPIVRPPGQLVRMTAAQIALTAPPDTTVTVQIRWSPWLSLDTDDAGACIRAEGDSRVQLRTRVGGSYRIGSTLAAPARHC
jgi:MFS family permease